MIDPNNNDWGLSEEDQKDPFDDLKDSEDLSKDIPEKQKG